MKRKPLTHAARLLCVLALSMSLTPAAFAAAPSEPTQPSPCYPTAVTRSEDGTEIRKMYDLGPEDDPGGIPRSDFDQDGYHYTLIDLLKQELPANESRQHTETVSVNSKSKDMGAVLAPAAADKGVYHGGWPVRGADFETGYGEGGGWPGMAAPPKP